MRIRSAKSLSASGFTLVEMLVMILAIALLTAMAMPILGRANQSAGFARDIENARSLASVAQGAEAAGVAVVDPGGSVEQTLRTLAAGVTVTRGAMSGQEFRIAVGEAEIVGAARFLRIENGLLLYTPQ
jgi:type II secretory pathway pseudopilin PulG